ncbi:transposase [Mesorhizobium sp. M1A.F.Ca.ET.072.01.1.1]|uniref:transposase n=1 Tax=Mesorhizobium sp. M1A.F.Ca.ET.072.01.1.1 TaxID=2496753 RepID=UPI001AECC7E2|nr:transposase [Mesorhizobium sp. M1A.F.Ca.ET.072.01.1.1]
MSSGRSRPRTLGRGRSRRLPSGQWRTEASSRDGRANVRRALYKPALVAARFNPDLREKYQHLIASGKPAKIYSGVYAQAPRYRQCASSKPI